MQLIPLLNGAFSIIRINGSWDVKVATKVNQKIRESSSSLAMKGVSENSPKKLKTNQIKIYNQIESYIEIQFHGFVCGFFNLQKIEFFYGFFKPYFLKKNQTLNKENYLEIVMR